MVNMEGQMLQLNRQVNKVYAAVSKQPPPTRSNNNGITVVCIRVALGHCLCFWFGPGEKLSNVAVLEHRSFVGEHMLHIS